MSYGSKLHNHDTISRFFHLLLQCGFDNSGQGWLPTIEFEVEVNNPGLTHCLGHESLTR